MNEILSVGQARLADSAAEAAEILTYSLMRKAGEAVAAEAIRRAPEGRVTVLCGPGANGGDGFVAATALSRAGRQVDVRCIAPLDSLRGDAARAAQEWGGDVNALTPDALDGASLVIDALFGAGLARPLDGLSETLARASQDFPGVMLAVDIPSGLHGDLARPLDGACFRADATVTFFRPKPAHLLHPGRALCGRVILADIGIPDAVLPALNITMWENAPTLWMDNFPWPADGIHKHSRGRLAVLCGGPLATGAARLAIAGGRRIGAGFTTLFGAADALAVAAAHETGAVLTEAGRGIATADAIRAFRAHAAILGPAAGADAATRDCILSLLTDGPALVLDADALSVFADAPDALLSNLRPDCVLTPHDGEFARIFPDLGPETGSKIDRVREAAARAGCVVLLKGPDTTIGAPDGRIVVNTESSPFLASAGTGDVLAGMTGGLLAQHMPAFDAACAAVWLHGRTGRMLGAGLIAEDIPYMLPALLKDIRS